MYTMYTEFNQYFMGLSTFAKVLWFIAVPSTVFYFMQLVMMLIGMGDHDMSSGHDFHMDVHTDADSFDVDVDSGDAGGTDSLEGSFNLLTVKNLIAFMMIFGWAGLYAIEEGWKIGTIIFFSCSLGITTIIILGLIMYILSKAQSSGTMDIRNALHQTGRVYIPIDPRDEGTGRVQIAVQGSTREIRAITKDREKLETGTPIRVVGIINHNTVEVEIIT